VFDDCLCDAICELPGSKFCPVFYEVVKVQMTEWEKYLKYKLTIRYA
jgi:hypothetical protein